MNILGDWTESALITTGVIKTMLLVLNVQYDEPQESTLIGAYEQHKARYSWQDTFYGGEITSV